MCQQELYNVPAIFVGNIGWTISRAHMESWNHPRVCGENLCETEASNASKGSPPRMRGAPALSKPSESQFGITPAYAGKVTDLLRSQSRIAVSCSYYVTLEGNRFAQNVNMVECLSRVDERGIS